MMIGIGIDCCDVRRMEKKLSDGRFLQRFFTDREQAYILDKNASAAQSLAGHFAAKEAGLKALGCGIAHPLTEIEIAHDELGAPYYNLSGGAKDRMLSMGGRKLHLSITHTGDIAAAVAVLEGNLLDISCHSIDPLINPPSCEKTAKRCEGESALSESSFDDFSLACNNGLEIMDENDERCLLKKRMNPNEVSPPEEIPTRVNNVNNYAEEKEALLSRIIAGRFPYSIITDADIRAILPKRSFDAHKGSCGHTLIVAGSFGMAGAASLCVNAALRGGAGLVTAACPREIIPIVQTQAPCAMCVPTEELQNTLSMKNAVAAGPGLGKSEALDQSLQTLLSSPLPQVWDADALNWLSRHPERLSPAFVLTPHYGEAARLLNAPVQQVIDDPVEAVYQLHARYGTVILLKGPVTLITDGENLAANLTGSPGMATGGSGDVLTGLIAAFLAQGVPPYNAARAAAFLHGRAGESAAARKGVRSMTAQDILNALRIE